MPTAAVLAAVLLGYQLLASDHGRVDLPLVGEVAWETSLAVEPGVYATVVAAARLVIETLASGDY